MTSNATFVWLPRVFFESALIVISILVALGFDEWRENREDEELIRHALTNFLIEMQQNKLRVDDAAPFNSGLRQVLDTRYIENELMTVDEFILMVESYSAINLQSTAWETALATGSLAKMNYSLVSALSLTYGLQNRYTLVNRDGFNEILSPQNLNDETLRHTVYNSVRYLDRIATMETELGIVYGEAIALIEAALSNDTEVLSTNL